ncbi:hypothetical protein [Holospora undulata]|uniref:Uncharacterized protein n=1 Tax=Holospora undulata HU1 TaxID=1321371 RepID=A0A061JIR3_9PROT|nr:hypothetical protein [Holospora undulata]ETZ05024.1 hypothetical protein K737_300539 [Holospora undulata HU1]
MKLFKTLILCVNNFSYAKILTEEDCVALRTQHRQEKNLRVANRIKAVLLSDKGGSYRRSSD